MGVHIHLPHLGLTSNTSWCFSLQIASRLGRWQTLSSLSSEAGFRKAGRLPSWHKEQQHSWGGLMIVNSQQETFPAFFFFLPCDAYGRLPHGVFAILTEASLVAHRRAVPRLQTAVLRSTGSGIQFRFKSCWLWGSLAGCPWLICFTWISLSFLIWKTA